MNEKIKITYQWSSCYAHNESTYGRFDPNNRRYRS